MIGKVFVNIDIIARSKDSKNYILEEVLSVDMIFEEFEGIESSSCSDGFLVGEMTGAVEDIRNLRAQYPKSLVSINVRQHKIDSLDI